MPDNGNIVTYQGIKELIKREGLPNVIPKMKAGDEVTVAYLGGSITEVEGWRPLTLEWFRQHYRNGRIKGINASCGGTGADLAAARLKRDSLDYGPDLVFVEFQVNGGGPGLRMYKAIEGIIRQIWSSNLKADICLVYTLWEKQTACFHRGDVPERVVFMEELAAHYGIPSIQLGVPVARLEKEGKLVFRGTADQVSDAGSRLVFTLDGYHPLEAGSQIYADSVARCFMAMDGSGGSGRRELRAPLYADNWENARLAEIPVDGFKGSWTVLRPESDPIAQKYSDFPARFPLLYRSDIPGDSYTVRFKGRTVGFYDISGPDSGQFLVSVDGRPPVLYDRFGPLRVFQKQTYFYIDELEDGVHTVTFTVHHEISDKLAVLAEDKKSDFLDNPDKYSGKIIYLGLILVVGELL